MQEISQLKLRDYLHQLLNVANFKDAAPNGLQVAGAKQIRKIVTGVTASQDLIKAAIKVKADAIMVHHGYFWHGEQSEVLGIKASRLKLLLENNINLYAYHLPLDAHQEYGNNVQLAKLLNLPVSGTTELSPEFLLGNYADLAQGISCQDMAEHIADKLGRAPMVIQGNQRLIKRIAWCTGAAQKYIETIAENYQIDAYISGEVSLTTYDSARELEINYFSAGHHATERYGIKSLGEHLAAYFGVDVAFIDINNPI